MDQKVIAPYKAVSATSAQIDFVKNGVLHVNGEARAICVTAETDLAQLEGYAPGSVAFTAGFKNAWQLGADGTWTSMLEVDD